MENTQSSFTKWFRSEVAAAFAVGMAVVGFMMWVTSPVNSLNTQMAVLQTQVDNIKNNDLTHIELSQQETATTLKTLAAQNVIILQELSAINAVLKVRGQ